MIISDHIYISYSPECSVEYCFWKYFFQVSGFWVKEEVIVEDWNLDYTKTPQLVLLNKKNEKKLGKERSQIVYCVRKSSKISNRGDIIKADWWNEYYYSVLKQLYYENSSLLLFMRKMICIFVGTGTSDLTENVGNGLWSAVWLFHEIAQMSAKEDWDRHIADKALETIKSLKQEKRSSSENWHYIYASLYCEYMWYGVNRSGMYRMRQGEWLLEKCKELAGIIGWSPALSFLAGKISLLASTLNKDAIYYYRNIIEYEVQADILYEIGHIYEKAYGDMMQAWYYYQWAYHKDPDCYRALYKIALKLEAEGDWLRAMGTYSRVIEIIVCTKVKNDISIRRVEYEYKSCKQILRLSSRHVDDIEFQNVYSGRIFDMKYNIAEYIDLGKITKQMFARSDLEKRRQELMEELSENLNIECCY